MKTTMILAAIALAGTAHAQQPATPNFLSSNEVRALIARAARDIKPDQPTLSLPMVAADGYVARLEYRHAVGPAAIHETDTKLFYVIEGSGTLITGGALVNGSPRPGGNLSGSSIDGGMPRRVAPGDIIVVPAGTPHFFSAIDGKLVLVSLHMAAGALAKR